MLRKVSMVKLERDLFLRPRSSKTCILRWRDTGKLRKFLGQDPFPFFCALFAFGHFSSPFWICFFLQSIWIWPLFAPPGPFGELRLEEEGRGESGRETCPRRHNHTTQPTQPHAQPTLYKKATQPRTSNILHNPHYHKYPTQPTLKSTTKLRNPKCNQEKPT